MRYDRWMSKQLVEWDVSGSRWNLPLLDDRRDISGSLELVGFESA
jgi:hypothetical protein